MTLKILSGKFKGKSINVPQTDSVRPILTRLRKSLLDTIRNELNGASFLDLFGGSGSVTFEALSNGVRFATIVELDRINFQTIRKNARLLGLSSQVEIVHGDAINKIKKFYQQNRKFDFIYIAPPQYLGLINRAFDQLSKNRIYHPETLIITQCHPKEKIDALSSKFYLLKSRRHGNTTLDYYRIK